MTFLELAKERCSIRSFSQKPVEQEKLAQILEAGRLAPTACNNQPQRIKVITLLICYDNTVCWKSPFNGGNSGEVDASIVTTHLMFAAQELGLGTCWVMHFDPAKAIELFCLPENIVPVAILPIGYAADDAKPADGHYSRKAIEEILI